jgi:hypothetical protein
LAAARTILNQCPTLKNPVYPENPDYPENLDYPENPENPDYPDSTIWLLRAPFLLVGRGRMAIAFYFFGLNSSLYLNG